MIKCVHSSKIESGKSNPVFFLTGWLGELKVSRFLKTANNLTPHHFSSLQRLRRCLIFKNIIFRKQQKKYWSKFYINLFALFEIT